jgi:cation diffusion facilitator CzcD-associated flavoprotein CzcO
VTVERTRTIIVGSGFAGLAMAIELRRRGDRDFVIVERASTIGGTWRDNHYPGCACDVPAHLYSYSYFPNPDWSTAFAPQPEIRAYIERCADHFDLRRHLRMSAEVTGAAYDEARAEWTVRCADGRTFVGEACVVATGGLSRPSTPKLPGLEKFAGETWHSAAWNHDVPLAGKRVAVIGTGASAIQFVPRIAPQVGKLSLFQRTPPWILPRPDHTFTRAEEAAFRVPGVRWAYRAMLYWRHEVTAIPFTLEPRILELAQRLAVWNLKRRVKDPALRAKLTPDYTMGCKRILMSNDYYPAVARDNVDVVTAGIREVTPGGIVTADGVHHDVDVIIFGTGFDVHDYVGPVRVTGRGGLDLGDAWRISPEAYLGTTMPGFPNAFVIVGPNTGLGHNSMIFMIECQARYIAGALAHMRARDLAAIEPTVAATRRYNDRVQERLAGTVWASGCKSWYQDASGKNTTLWPGSTAEFFARTYRFDVSAYRTTSRVELLGRAMIQRRAA